MISQFLNNYYGTHANTFVYVSENIQTRELNFDKTCLCKRGARVSIQLHCKKFWVIALPNFGQMYALPKKNGQKPNFFWV